MLITQNQLSAVYTGLKNVFQEGFMMTGSGIEDDWKQVALEAPSETEQEEYGFLRNMSNIREWIGDRYLQSLVEASYIIKNKHFEGTIAVPADKIADRKLGNFNIPTKQLGQNARVFPNRLVFPLLAAGFTNRGFDGQYFFDANHPVMRPDGGTDLVSNNQGGAGPAWFLLDTTKIIKPVVYQNRQPFNFASLTDMSKSDHVFMRNEYLFGVDGRCNVGWFAETLGIKSPSRVFMGFGNNIGEGAQIGILKGVPGVQGAVGKLAGVALAGAVAASGSAFAGVKQASQMLQGVQASGAVQPGAAGAAGMTIHFAPTIHVGAGGGDMRGQVNEAMQVSMRDLEQMLRRLQAEQQRRAF